MFSDSKKSYFKRNFEKMTLEQRESVNNLTELKRLVNDILNRLLAGNDYKKYDAIILETKKLDGEIGEAIDNILNLVGLPAGITYNDLVVKLEKIVQSMNELEKGIE